jgi:TonB family protein
MAVSQVIDMNKLICVLTLATLAAPAVMLADDDLAVVVNKANSANNLTKSQLRKLVLGEQGSWPGGAKVTVVLRDTGTAERDGVLRSVCRMTEDDFNEYLKHADFSHETGGAPKIMPSAAAVRNLVANTPGAIGFLPPAEVNDSVKAVSVDGKSAGQGSYAIKYSSASDNSLRIAEVDARNAATVKPVPVYPAVAKQLKISGRVVVEAVVTEAGTVKQAKTLSGNVLLATSAMDAVKKWKFKPFQANGKASEAIVTLSFTFNFTND